MWFRKKEKKKQIYVDKNNSAKHIATFGQSDNMLKQTNTTVRELWTTGSTSKKQIEIVFVCIYEHRKKQRVQHTQINKHSKTEQTYKSRLRLNFNETFYNTERKLPEKDRGIKEKMLQKQIRKAKPNGLKRRLQTIIQCIRSSAKPLKE